MFIDSTILTQAVHDVLQLDASTSLGAYWTTLVDRALNFSYWEIVNRLMQRGYSKSVIDQWDRGAEFQKDLGVWYCLQWISTQTVLKVEQSSISLVDRRTDLSGGEKLMGSFAGMFGKAQRMDPVMITVGGILMQPDTQVGGPTTGAIEGGGAVGYPWEEPAANGPPWDGRPLDANFDRVGT